MTNFPEQHEPRRTKTQNPILKALGSLLFLILFIGKNLLALLKLGKFSSLLSMIFMIWVYSLRFGWTFALGFVLLIFVHELGHALVLRKEGIPFGSPVFIPFVGAVIAMRGVPRNAWVEAKVGIGGPLLGSLGALGCFLVGLTMKSDFFYALASTGFVINLFNMLPISPMDGGRIAAAVSRWLLVIGLLLGGFLYLKTQSALLLIMLIFGFFQTLKSFRAPPTDYYNIPKTKKWLMGACYMGLVAILFYLYSVTQQALVSFDEVGMALIYSGSLFSFISRSFFSILDVDTEKKVVETMNILVSLRFIELT